MCKYINFNHSIRQIMFQNFGNNEDLSAEFSLSSILVNINTFMH